LGKSASYRAGHAGQIPYVELGGMWIVKEDWLETRWTEAEELAAAKRAAAAEQQQQQTEAKRGEATGEVPQPRRLRRAEGKSVPGDAGKRGPLADGGGHDENP
jgi:hypothetical protein